MTVVALIYECALASTLRHSTFKLITATLLVFFINISQVNLIFVVLSSQDEQTALKRAIFLLHKFDPALFLHLLLEV